MMYQKNGNDALNRSNPVLRAFIFSDSYTGGKLHE